MGTRLRRIKREISKLALWPEKGHRPHQLAWNPCLPRDPMQGGNQQIETFCKNFPGQR